MREAEIKRTMLFHFIPTNLDNQPIFRLELFSPVKTVETVKNSYLHEKHQLDSWFSPQQLTEGVDKQVKGEQAELNQQHQSVVVGLERLRPEGWAPGRTVVPRWIQGCTALAHTHYIEASIPTKQSQLLGSFSKTFRWLHSDACEVWLI